MKISRKELQRIIREEKARLRREDMRSASRKTTWVSGDAGKKSRVNRLRRLDEQSTEYTGNEHLIIEPASEKIEEILNDLYDNGIQNPELIALLQQIIKDIERGFVGEPT